MNHYSREDIMRIVDEEDVEFIRLQFTDIFGNLKNVAITSSQLEKALNNQCMFDGSSIEGFKKYTIYRSKLESLIKDQFGLGVGIDQEAEKNDARLNLA